MPTLNNIDSHVKGLRVICQPKYIIDSLRVTYCMYRQTLRIQEVTHMLRVRGKQYTRTDSHAKGLKVDNKQERTHMLRVWGKQ